MLVLDITGPSYEALITKHPSTSRVQKMLWIFLTVGLSLVIAALAGVTFVLYNRRATIVILDPKRSSKLLTFSSPPLPEVNLNVDYEKMNLDRENPVGSGSFGVVYSGVYDQKKVAVKVLCPAFQVC